MSIQTEGAPQEVLEEVSDNRKDIAARAKDELINIEQSGDKEINITDNNDLLEKLVKVDKKDFNTTAITDFKIWLKTKALQNEKSTIEIEQILHETGFIMGDEKSLTREKVLDITMMLDEFITNPIKYKSENPSNLNMLISLLEACSK